MSTYIPVVFRELVKERACRYYQLIIFRNNNCLDFISQ